MFDLFKKRKCCTKGYFDEPQCHLPRYYLDNWRFIWGVRSNDDLTNHQLANFNTVNDIEIIYDYDTLKYRLSIEEIYGFDSFLDKTLYLNRLFWYFGKYLDSCNISIPNYKETDIDIIKEDFDERLKQNKPLFDCEASRIIDLYIMLRAKLDYFHEQKNKVELKAFLH